MPSSISVHIIGTGHAVPAQVLDNEQVSRIVDTSDEWITTRTGIKRRHIAADNESNSDFSTLAAERALESAGVDAKDIDYIIEGTVTGDLIFPSTACLIQDRLGAHNATAFDISAACAGFLFGLNAAKALLASGAGKRALVLGSETLSRITNWQDRSTCVLFGDGAGAVVLEAREGSEGGILATYTRSDGRLADLLSIPLGGSRNPITPKMIEERSNKIQMKGNEVFKHAVRNMEHAARKVMEDTDLNSQQIDLLIPHQANIRIIEALGERLEVPNDRVFVNIQDYGNTSAASIPIALDQARRGGRIGNGAHVLMVAFGGGFTWGASLARF